MELVIRNLTKNFDKKEVLKGINFEFEKGKIYRLLGRNGAGKTTLFNCINEDIEVNSGEFYLKELENKKIKSEDIGYVLSTPNVPEFLTGREFLKFFVEINQDRIKHNKILDEYFDFMKIDLEDRDKLLKDYSHGMKNKMQMLVNIIASPMLLFITGGTDNILNYAILFFSIIGMSIFFSVHYLVMYYLLQPYNVNTEMKSSTYQVVQSITYVICFCMINIKLPTIYFGVVVIVFSILYSFISLFLAYKYAPKTYKIRI